MVVDYKLFFQMQLGFNEHSGTANWAFQVAREVQFSGLVLTNEARAVGLTFQRFCWVDSASLQIWFRLEAAVQSSWHFLKSYLKVKRWAC